MKTKVGNNVGSNTLLLSLLEPITRYYRTVEIFYLALTDSFNAELQRLIDCNI